MQGLPARDLYLREALRSPRSDPPDSPVEAPERHSVLLREVPLQGGQHHGQAEDRGEPQSLGACLQEGPRSDLPSR